MEMYCENLSQYDPVSYTNVSILQEIPYNQLNQIYFPVSYHIKTSLAPLWFILSLFGNCLSFIVWHSPRIRQENSSAVYLMTLALAELSFMFLYMLEHGTSVYQQEWWLHHIIICETFQTMYVFTQYYCVSLVFAFTVERYIAICFPFHRQKLCTPKRALTVVMFLGFLNFILGLFAGLLWSVDDQTKRCEANRFEPELLYFSEFLVSLVLPTGTLIFNILVIAEMRKMTKSSALRSPLIVSSQPVVTFCTKERTIILAQNTSALSTQQLSSMDSQRQEGRESMSSRLSISTTSMLLSVSFIFILCTLPAGLIWCLQTAFPIGNECIRREQLKLSAQWRNYFTYQSIKVIVDTFSLIHYSCNFIIYFLTSEMFRKEATRLLTCQRYTFKSGSFQLNDGQRSVFLRNHHQNSCSYVAAHIASEAESARRQSHFRTTNAARCLAADVLIENLPQRSTSIIPTSSF